MHVGQEDSIQIIGRHAHLGQPHRGPTANVKLQSSVIALVRNRTVTDKRSGTRQPVNSRWTTLRPRQDYFKAVLRLLFRTSDQWQEKNCEEKTTQISSPALFRAPD